MVRQYTYLGDTLFLVYVWISAFFWFGFLLLGLGAALHREEIYGMWNMIQKCRYRKPRSGKLFSFDRDLYIPLVPHTHR